MCQCVRNMETTFGHTEVQKRLLALWKCFPWLENLKPANAQTKQKLSSEYYGSTAEQYVPDGPGGGVKLLHYCYANKWHEILLLNVAILDWHLWLSPFMYILQCHCETLVCRVHTEILESVLNQFRFELSTLRSKPILPRAVVELVFEFAMQSAQEIEQDAILVGPRMRTNGVQAGLLITLMYHCNTLLYRCDTILYHCDMLLYRCHTVLYHCQRLMHLCESDKVPSLIIMLLHIPEVEKHVT